MDCVLCKGGLEKGQINYPADLSDKFILIKEVPADICKQCGEFYLDDEVFKKIEDIVNHIDENKIGIEIEVIKYNKPA